MTRHDRALALVTLAAIAIIVGLAVAPPTVRMVAICVCFLAYLVGLWWMFRRPLTDTDAYCSWADEELERREALNRVAGSNVVELPERESARIIHFPTGGTRA